MTDYAPHPRAQTQAFRSTDRSVVALRAFTLVELLVVIAILAILISLLLPAARGAISTARAFKCQTAQRSVAFDFQVWADETLHPPRGNDDLPVAQGGAGRGKFRVETFQESLYGLDEFWSDNSVNTVRLPDRTGRDPMRCVEVPGAVVLNRYAPCSQGGVGPATNVSYGFNIRLHWSELRLRDGLSYEVSLTPAILEGSGVVSPAALPLMMDVDGRIAAASDRTPVFTGPQGASTSGLYDGWWFPGKRHLGAMNVAFVDGHVESSKSPETQQGWAWDFTPAR